MKKLQKFEVLKGIRKSMGWTQVRMAEELGLDATYLSQLENGRQPLKECYLLEAERLKEQFEKSKLSGYGNFEFKEHAGGTEVDIRGRCHEHLDLVLDACQHNREEMAWTYVELKRRFPVVGGKSSHGGKTSGEVIELEPPEEVQRIRDEAHRKHPLNDQKPPHSTPQSGPK